MRSYTIAALCLLLAIASLRAHAGTSLQSVDLNAPSNSDQTTNPPTPDAATQVTSQAPSQENSQVNSPATLQPAPESTPLGTYQHALNYLLGRNGVEKSAEKAASLFKALAEQNWSSAQHMLGNMYLHGKGVEKNDLLAYKWLSLASKNNMQLAKAIQTKRRQLYQNLQNNLSLQSLNKVETWIAEWKPSKATAQLN